MSNNPSRTVITPMFRISYPALDAPRAFKENGKDKGDPVYSLTMIFDADDMAKFRAPNEAGNELVYTDFAQVCASLAKEAWPDISVKEAVTHGGLQWPIQQGDAQIKKMEAKGKKGDYSYLAGKKIIRAKSTVQYAPKLTYFEGKVKKELTPGMEISASKIKSLFAPGSFAMAEINVVAAVFGERKYLTCYMNAVHFMKSGPRIGGQGGLMDRFSGVLGGETDHDPTQGLDDDEIPY